MDKKVMEALRYVNSAQGILEEILADINATKKEPVEEPKDKKVKLTIKVENPYDGVEIDEKELEQIRKDLEEIINDFTRE